LFAGPRQKNCACQCADHVDRAPDRMTQTELSLNTGSKNTYKIGLAKAGCKRRQQPEGDKSSIN
jgi:hypothetical protein